MTKILGTTDEITTCECCGKRGLKMTVALECNGEVVHFGRDCAAAALTGRKSSKVGRSVELLARAADFARRSVSKLGRDEIHRRLTVAGWANFDGRAVWNDAGRVEVAA
jgi:hypothetical protein